MKNKNLLYVTVLVLVIASVAFRLLNGYQLEQTTLLFVGLPTLITLLLIRYSKTPKSIYGVVFRTITLFLLMSAILFGEGLVCIIFMAPIFYGTAAIIVGAISYYKNKDNSKLNVFIAIPLFIIYSDFYSINSEPQVQIITTSKTIKYNQNLEKLNALPDFMEDYPSFFKIGFPKPILIEGSGIEVGDFRKIHFESNTKGIGILHIKIKEKNNNSITFEIIEDTTHMNHWMTWKEFKVTIEENESKESEIIWTTKFICDLGPSWYFEPMEKYGVKVMNTHLTNTFFN